MLECKSNSALKDVSLAIVALGYALTIVKSGVGVEEGSTVAERVKALMAQRGWSYAQLAGRAGIDPTTAWKIGTGKTPNPGSETLRKLSDALGVALSELTGEKPMPRRKAEVTEGVARLPLRRLRVQADGHPSWDDTNEWAYASASAARGRPNAFAAIVTGECMVPNVNPGDTVLVDPDRAPTDRDLVVVTDDTGATMVKWYRIDKSGEVYLRAADGTRLKPNGAKIEGVVFRRETDDLRDQEP